MDVWTLALCSIYERLVEYCGIDELGTNFPKVREERFAHYVSPPLHSMLWMKNTHSFEWLFNKGRLRLLSWVYAGVSASWTFITRSTCNRNESTVKVEWLIEPMILFLTYSAKHSEKSTRNCLVAFTVFTRVHVCALYKHTLCLGCCFFCSCWFHVSFNLSLFASLPSPGCVWSTWMDQGVILWSTSLDTKESAWKEREGESRQS